jgi:hypothetical protein
VGIKTADGSKLLCNIDSATKWMTDREVTSFLTVSWNKDSTVLATHEALGRHSRLNLYWVRDGGADSLEVPDLLAPACAALGIKRSAAQSSGQLPEKWIDATTLEVRVRVKAGGRERSKLFTLRIGDDGSVSFQPRTR